MAIAMASTVEQNLRHSSSMCACLFTLCTPPVPLQAAPSVNTFAPPFPVVLSGRRRLPFWFVCVVSCVRSSATLVRVTRTGPCARVCVSNKPTGLRTSHAASPQSMTGRRHVARPWLRPRPRVSAAMARRWCSTSAQMAHRCRSCSESGPAWRA